MRACGTGNFPLWLAPDQVRVITLNDDAVSVRLHHGGPQGSKPKAEVIAKILANIKERKA